ncbi:hypothetical protein OK348_14745 [Flavobacterium sp. MXW15]|uniref:Uncharacterized protein n=1 Tax=Xanthomonas chitinilytica TaxID=2989819 RepID=A0ABT3JZJ6_9XANT|nr:hypothetical protein [Xanthomonas sp. H13-6]MCW4456047.1 hypothetical protein [Flavobacterium sp. MXW15]MCW4473644.1 hypothetical protein [Xanthomonas sp. H13-6]
MNKTTLSSTLVLALAGAVALAGCKKQQEESVTDTLPPPTATTPEPAPVDPAAVTPVAVTSVTVGNAAAADKSVEPKALLGTQDKIIVSVRTDGTASNANVAARLTFQDGQLAGEQGATLNTVGAETTNIEFSNANGWPAGKYRAEVTVDGNPVGMPQEFEVK